MYLDYCAPHLSLLLKLNSFFILALFPPGILDRREEKSSATIVRKLTGSSKMQSTFFAVKDIWNIFCDFFKNLETTHIVEGGGSCYLHHYVALRAKIEMWLIPYGLDLVIVEESGNCITSCKMDLIKLFYVKNWCINWVLNMKITHMLKN